MEDLRVGDSVVVFDPQVMSNGTNVHAAIVTRLWGNDPHPTCNVKVFPDCGDVYDMTSIQHAEIAPASKGYVPRSYVRLGEKR